MLLAIDIGNTNIVIGCIQNDEILFQARIATDRTRTSDQYGVEIKNMLEAFGVRRENITDCIIYYRSSVSIDVWNNGRFFSLEDAYNHGLLSKEDVAMIAEIHNNVRYTTNDN